MEKPKELFLVWQDSEDELFFNQYETLQDAVACEEKDDDESVEVYKASLQRLGEYKITTNVVKQKQPKGKK